MLRKIHFFYVIIYIIIRKTECAGHTFGSLSTINLLFAHNHIQWHVMSMKLKGVLLAFKGDTDCFCSARWQIAVIDVYKRQR